MLLTDMSHGWRVDLGSSAVLLPPGWLYVPRSGVILCGNHHLRQQITLVIAPNPETSPPATNGDPPMLSFGSFSGERVEREVKPTLWERLLFRQTPHFRLEWLLRSDACCAAAFYLAEPNEDRQHITNQVERLFLAIQIVN